MIESIEKTKCTGCKMCADICPKAAISFDVNEEGFWYPIVDESSCIHCNACINKCPISNVAKEVFVTKREAYAAWSKNDEVRRESTSGGLYYEFAHAVIKENGFIVGSVYTDDYCGAYHVWGDNLEDLKRIMGSKYFQSDTSGIYKKTKDLLETGRKVLFTGTPCQAAALKRYLQREYKNLILIDFICRGVPSPLLQREKIELYSEKAKSSVIFYRDKSKKYGWDNFGELVRFQNGKDRFISRWKDDINNCFIERNLNLRESCYSCRYKNGNNASDITIGDFWGIENVTKRDLELGVSAMIVNTEKGSDFIRQISKSIYYIRKPLEEVTKGNSVYVNPAERPKQRKGFFEEVLSKGLEKAVKNYAKLNFKAKLAREKMVLKSKLKSYIVLFKLLKDVRWLCFIKLNFFSRAVHREKGAFLIPCRGSVLQISPEANIYLKANMLFNYYPCYKRGNQTSLFKMEKGAKLYVHNQIEFAYGNTFSIAQGAEIETGTLYTGMNANIICNYKMYIGNNVMLGRDTCIFDSDYHVIFNDKGEKINNDKEVVIEDNVWVGARSMILKGSHLNIGAIISANSVVLGEVEENRVFINKRESKSIGGNITWKR